MYARPPRRTAVLTEATSYTVLVGDCRAAMRSLPEAFIQCAVTSPPYFGLRDYGVDGQIGLETTPEAYVAAMVEVFREVRRVLRNDGTLWLNLGDSYASSAKGTGGNGETSGLMRDGRREEGRNSKATAIARQKHETVRLMCGVPSKNLLGIPWRVAFALQADGWYLRQDIIWHKPNPMPESITDRCTKAHEYLFLLSKSERYYFDSEAMKEPASGRDPGNKAHKHADRVAAEVAAGNHRERTKLGLATMGASETRNRRSVWTVASRPYKGAHFATFPPDLIEPCVLAGSKPGDTVLDPFGGSGTTAGVAVRNGRRAVLCELNPEYAALVPGRVADIVARSRPSMDVSQKTE